MRFWVFLLIIFLTCFGWKVRFLQRSHVHFTRVFSQLFICDVAYLLLTTRTVSSTNEIDLISKGAVFAHIHIAKTAGSSFNRILARNFFGICGYKGYSFMQPFEDIFINVKDPRYPRRHRNKVAQPRMFDWGFHNCALISDETK